MTAEVWVLIGTVVTAGAGLAVAYMQFVLPLKRQSEESSAKAADTPAGSLDWSREYLASLVKRAEELETELGEVIKDRSRMFRKHSDLRVEFAEFRAEARFEISLLKKQIEAKERSAELQLQKYRDEIRKLEELNQRLQEEIQRLKEN